MTYRVIVERDRDPGDDERMPNYVTRTEFQASSDVTVLQAVALFLNHVTQEEKYRETKDRIFRVDPNLEREFNRAQLYQHLGFTPQPNEPGPGEFYGHPGPQLGDYTRNGADEPDAVRPATGEEKLYQDGD